MTRDLQELQQLVRRVIEDLEDRKTAGINARSIGIRCVEIDDPEHELCVRLMLAEVL